MGILKLFTFVAQGASTDVYIIPAGKTCALISVNGNISNNSTTTQGQSQLADEAEAKLSWHVPQAVVGQVQPNLPVNMDWRWPAIFFSGKIRYNLITGGNAASLTIVVEEN